MHEVICCPLFHQIITLRPMILPSCPITILNQYVCRQRMTSFQLSTVRVKAKTVKDFSGESTLLVKVVSSRNLMTKFASPNEHYFFLIFCFFHSSYVGRGLE